MVAKSSFIFFVIVLGLIDTTIEVLFKHSSYDIHLLLLGFLGKLVHTEK